MKHYLFILCVCLDDERYFYNSFDRFIDGFLTMDMLTKNKQIREMRLERYNPYGGYKIMETYTR